MKKLSILGIRGIPAAHGGFETFAEYLSLYLVNNNWQVTVYCQEDSGDTYESMWNGVKLIHIPVTQKGALGTIVFDLKSILHSLKSDDLLLTLGYNTAIFNILHYLSRRKNIINMDGIEWKRDKWGPIAKSWFWLNERFGCWFGSHLIADHPRIKEHLETRVKSDKVTMIPYGALHIDNAPVDVLERYGIAPHKYLMVIARAEPENSILEIVKGFSSKKRDIKLVVLGNYNDSNNYHKLVKDSASEDVLFLGAIYDSSIVSTLRYFSLAYVHGHRVGGTNPSLVEALGAGNAVIAHDNHFNRWVVGSETLFFSSDSECSEQIDLITSDLNMVARMKASSVERFNERFTWREVLSEYEKLLSSWLIK
ncbi:DUF1972 domain-containing protein [Serratia fonticola]|uniref:DUF1972 domain-containing protein n=1 Tax=Serratia fonticola TaxID=47917 RepID=UPI00192C37C3|nr:DUF1972 domain-containing protein [Serratia fonticola]MBL5902095.1 DUF1972 domain-containing protein [Serratia fonticola]